MRLLFLLAASASILPLAAAFGAEAADRTEVEELIVTAQKREQNLADVPVSLTVVGSEKLANIHANGPEDLTQLAPGLVFQKTVGISTPFLRGVGNTSVLQGDEGAVALYIDGVYQNSMAMSALPFNGVEHVEVLKGPQGTLFGRNATGGVISILTRSPSETFAGRLSTGYGNYRTTTLSAYLTGPIAPNLTANISYESRQQDKGFVRNLTTGNTINLKSFRTVRSKIAFTPTEQLDFELILDYAKFNDTTAGDARSTYPGTIPATAAQRGALFSTSRKATYSPVDPYHKGETWSAAFKARADVGFADLVSITAYRNSTVNLVGSTNMTSVDNVAPFTVSFSTASKDPFFLSQEVQLVSHPNEKIDWIVGAFYQNSKGKYSPQVIRFQVGGPPIIGFVSSMETKAIAGFAQGTYNLTDKLSAVAGARYSDEEKTVDFVGLYANAAFAPISNLSHSWDDWTYKLGLNYKPDADSIVYLSYTTGFKSGVFNNVVADARLVKPVDPEEIKAWELGGRWNVGGPISISGSAFRYRYTNLQYAARDAISGAYILQNAAAAKIYGFELEAQARPLDHLTLSANVSYVHARYTNFANAQVFVPNPPNVGGNTQVPTDVSGNRVVRAPDWTGTLQGNYEWPLADGGAVGIGANLYHSSAVPFDAAGRVRSNAFTTLGSQAYWNLPGDHWRISAWGKNITDKSYVIFVSPATIGDGTVFGEPRTYGVSVEYRW